MGFPNELGGRGPIECVSTLGRELRVCAHEYKCLTGQSPQSAGLYGGLQVIKQSLLRSLEAIEELLVGEERRALTAAGRDQEIQAPPLRRPTPSPKAPPDTERIQAGILSALIGKPLLTREIRSCTAPVTQGLAAHKLAYHLKELQRKGKIKLQPGRRWALA